MTLPDDVFKRDHDFWSKYSERLIGNWITYDTSVQQIADLVEKVYLRNNYSGFTGDRKFIRDDGGQKAFSKLRSSQAGVYAWRLRLLYPHIRRLTRNTCLTGQERRGSGTIAAGVRLRLQTVVRVLSLQPRGGHPLCQLPLPVQPF